MSCDTSKDFVNTGLSVLYCFYCILAVIMLGIVGVFTFSVEFVLHSALLLWLLASQTDFLIQVHKGMKTHAVRPSKCKTVF